MKSQGIGTTEIGKCSASTGGRTIDIGARSSTWSSAAWSAWRRHAGKHFASVTEADCCVVD